jgi:hypothetical protein
MYVQVPFHYRWPLEQRNVAGRLVRSLLPSTWHTCETFPNAAYPT